MPAEFRVPFQRPKLDPGHRPATEPPYRPYLILELSGPNGRGQRLRGIVDSGADYTCLPLSIAKSLGYKHADLQGRTIQQVSGDILARQAEEPLQAFVVGLPRIVFDIKPVFIEDCLPVWGRADFFAAFRRVTLEGRTLILTPH